MKIRIGPLGDTVTQSVIQIYVIPCVMSMFYFSFMAGPKGACHPASPLFSNYIKRALPRKKPACYLPVHSEESPSFFQKKLRLVSKRHCPQKFQHATDGAFRGNPTYEVCAICPKVLFPTKTPLPADIPTWYRQHMPKKSKIRGVLCSMVLFQVFCVFIKF